MITDGVDVQTVVSPTRHVPHRPQDRHRTSATAPARSAAATAPSACTVTTPRPFGDTHHTTYAELGNVCDQHHHLIHDRDYTIDDHRDGTWSLRAPPGEAAA